MQCGLDVFFGHSVCRKSVQVGNPNKIIFELLVLFIAVFDLISNKQLTFHL